jgi:N-acetylneuraminate synthase/sialic acid synthase
MRVGGRDISDAGACFVIAEIGHNHQGSVETCKKMFEAAANAGADAVKLQKRDNRSLFTAEMYDKPYENENSYGRTYGEHREFLEFGRGEYLELKEHARRLGLEFFSTAFDIASVEFLEEIDLPAYKVASADVTNVPLLRRLAQTGKPVIFSTGGARIEDVRRAYDVLREGHGYIGILQCTAGYPAAWEELDLRVIDTYRRMFPDAVIGLSSHDNGIAMAIAAYTLGARIVEKHFTLDRTMRGTDHKFSLEPKGMDKLVRDLTRLHVAMGEGMKRVYDSEVAPIKKMSKSIVANRALDAGTVLSADDLALKSPGGGMPGHQWDALIGKRLTKALSADEKLSPKCIEDGKKVNGNGKRRRKADAPASETSASTDRRG